MSKIYHSGFNYQLFSVLVQVMVVILSIRIWRHTLSLKSPTAAHLWLIFLPFWFIFSESAKTKFFISAGSLEKFEGSWNQTHDLSISSRLRLPLDHHYSPFKIKWKQELVWSSLQWNVRPVFISDFWPLSSSFNVSVDCEIIPFRNPNKLIDLRNLIFWSSINQHYRLFDFIAGWSTWNSFQLSQGQNSVVISLYGE